MSYIKENGTARGANFNYQGTEVAYIRFRQVKNGLTNFDTYPWLVQTNFAEYDVYYGRDLPNYHKRKAAGELLPFTTYKKVTHRLSTEASFQSNYVSGANTYNNYFTSNNKYPFLPAKTQGAGAFDTPGVISNCLGWLTERGIDPTYYVQAAASKLYSRGWDAATFFAELSKTVELVAGAARDFHKLLTSFDEWHKRFLTDQTVRQNASVLLQQWLEARYGWRLLLYDIEDISKFIKDLDKKTRARNKDHVGMEFSWTDDLSTVNEFGSSYQTYTDTRSVTANVRGSIIADFVPSKVIVNPFLTGWEVIPYSFVIDWFYGVGQALEALSFITLNDYYTSCYGISVQVERSGSLDCTWKAGWSGTAVQEVRQSYEYLIRHPTPVSALPFFQNKFDWAKGIDLLGLIDGLLRGVLRKWSIR
jgi:hypothetical protein